MLQAEATASDFSRVFSWRFLVYFISTEKWNEKKGNGVQIFTFLLEYRFVWSQRFQKKFQMIIWSENVFKREFDVAVFMVRGISLRKFLGGEHLSSSSTKTA